MKTKLNNLSKLAAFSLMFATTVLSQNITNTLGAGGLFKIKDAANDYLTLSQSTGEVSILKTLRLENTTSSTLGIIFKGADRFIHDYYPATSNNTFVGIKAGNFTLTTSNYNTGIGHSSLLGLTTGGNNTALGYVSLYSNTTGYNNSAVGYFSLSSNTTGYLNSAFGSYALSSNTTGLSNSAFGTEALRFNTTGYYNSAFGTSSLSLNTDGQFNSAFGYNSLSLNIDGYNNSAFGFNSLSSNTTGGYNSAFGSSALFANTTGFSNTALGWATGALTTGNNLTCIGYNAQPTTATATNQITLGNGSITSLRCNTTTITSLSDARDKKNINDLNLGINFLMKIKPRLFNWDKREWYDGNVSDGSKMKEEPTAGFIAQELDEAQTTGNAEWLNLVLKDNPEKWEATPGNLLPIMVKAIQDLNLKCGELKSENNMLKNNNEKLSAEVESLKSMSEKLVVLEQMVNELPSEKHAALVTKN